MIIQMNLYRGSFAYRDSIATMRTLLAIAGRKGYFQLDVVIEEGERPAASLLMSRETLYIDAFRGDGGTWYHFADSPVPFDAALQVGGRHSKVKALTLNGSHGALGTNTVGMTYSAFTPKALKDLSSYSGGNYDHLRLALSFAVVACAEAVRFKETEQRIERLLASDHESYKPLHDWQTLFKDWEKLTLSKSAKVYVRHAG
jgi:hypothetical protein